MAAAGGGPRWGAAPLDQLRVSGSARAAALQALSSTSPSPPARGPGSVLFFPFPAPPELLQSKNPLPVGLTPKLP